MNDVWALLQKPVQQQNQARKPKAKKQTTAQNQPKTEKAGPKTLQTKVWTDSKGVDHQYTVDESGWWTWLKKDNLQNPKSEPKPSKVPSVDVSGRDGCWVTGLRISDWEPACAPKLVSLPKVRAYLREGETVLGNIVEIWDLESLSELQTLWASFGPSQGITALLCGPAKQAQGACHSKFSLVRGGYGHKLESVGLLKLGSTAAPWFPSAKKIEIASMPKVERRTLRIAAPCFFRQPFLGSSSQDSPTQVIASLADLGQCSVSEFYGGRWGTQEKPEGKQLIAFLRLKKGLHESMTNFWLPAGNMDCS